MVLEAEPFAEKESKRLSYVSGLDFLPETLTVLSKSEYTDREQERIWDLFYSVKTFISLRNSQQFIISPKSIYFTNKLARRS